MVGDFSCLSVVFIAESLTWKIHASAAGYQRPNGFFLLLHDGMASSAMRKFAF